MFVSIYGTVRVKILESNNRTSSVYGNGILYSASQKGQESVTVSGSNQTVFGAKRWLECVLLYFMGFWQ
jgi:hypothetical protein